MVKEMHRLFTKTLFLNEELDTAVFQSQGMHIQILKL